MNKTRDVTNWYYCQPSSISLLGETLNLNKTDMKLMKEKGY
jgi:hypothetical protein